jgi:SAM-dependent methyltransferase
MRLLQKEHWWFRARRLILGELISRLGLRPGSRILEAGCGSGGNIRLLQDFGDVAAFDMDEEARSACREDTGIDCLHGFLPDKNPFQDSHAFDLAVMLDVLEHIDDDIGSLRSLATCLNENGVILITVPAYQWMYSGHDAVHHHKRRYSRRTLESVVVASGCSVVRSGYFNSILFPAIAAARMASKAFGFAPVSDMQMPGKGLNSILFRIFAAERKLVFFPGFGFGTSIFLIASPAPRRT